MTRGSRILAAIHVLGNAILLWLGYYWLGIAESRTATLAWSFVVVLLLVCLATWLHGATFVWWRGKSPGLADAFRVTLRHLVPLLVAAIGALAIYSLLGRWADYSSTPAFKIASYLTLRFRHPVKPATVLRIFNDVLWAVRWVVVPVFLLPAIGGVASFGWRGFRELARRAGDRRYWLLAPALLVCAFWIPLQLMGWVPHVGGFTLEMVSFVIRLVVAYLFFVASWLLLAFFTAGGRPLFSHSKTAASQGQGGRIE